MGPARISLESLTPRPGIWASRAGAPLETPVNKGFLAKFVNWKLVGLPVNERKRPAGHRDRRARHRPIGRRAQWPSAGISLSRIVQLDQRTALPDQCCSRRKRTWPPGKRESNQADLSLEVVSLIGPRVHTRRNQSTLLRASTLGAGVHPPRRRADRWAICSPGLKGGYATVKHVRPRRAARIGGALRASDRIWGIGQCHPLMQ